MIFHLLGYELPIVILKRDLNMNVRFKFVFVIESTFVLTSL